MGRHVVVDRGAEFDDMWAASLHRAAAHAVTAAERIERLREAVSDHYRMQRDRVRAARELEERELAKWDVEHGTRTVRAPTSS